MNPNLLSLRRSLAPARLRFRLERLLTTFPKLLLAASLLLFLLPPLLPIRSLVVFSTTGLLLGLGAAAAYLLPVPPRLLHARLDEKLHLPDSFLITGEMLSSPHPPTPWQELQLRQTLGTLTKIHWQEVWPLTLAPRTHLAGLLFCLALTFAGQHWHSSHHITKELPPGKRLSPLATTRIEQLEATFKDWETANALSPDPELTSLLKSEEPLRAQIAEAGLDERATLQEINRIQDTLKARLRQLEASTQPLAELAEKLEPSFQNNEATQSLQDSLGRADFAAAARDAVQQAASLHSGRATLPSGANVEQFAKNLERSAESILSYNPGTSAALQQLARAIRNEDKTAAAQAWTRLGMQFTETAKRATAEEAVKLQITQLELTKRGELQKSGPLQTSLAATNAYDPVSGVRGAGNTTDLDRFGESTKTKATLQKKTLTGIVGEGASDVATEPAAPRAANELTRTKPATQVSKSADKLSEQAVEQEDLPLAQREMIKRYFEIIRPNTQL